MNIKPFKKVDLDGLNKVNEINAQKNEIEKEFKNLKQSLCGQKIMLNAKDGNWVPATIKTFYYNSTSYGEQVKSYVDIEDVYYSSNYNKLFETDLFGYITLDDILESTTRYNNGEDAKVLFENINIGDKGFVYNKETPVEVTIIETLNDREGRFKIKVLENSKKNRTFGLFNKNKKEFKIDVVEYLNHQDRHKDENYKLYHKGGGDEFIIR